MKEIVIKVEKRNKEKAFAMLVMSANLKMNSKKVKTALDLRSIRFATEEEISEITQGIQRGGVPPFGNHFLNLSQSMLIQKCLKMRR